MSGCGGAAVASRPDGRRPVAGRAVGIAGLLALVPLAVLIVVWGGGAQAQVWAGGAPEVPRFETCLPDRMAAFETGISGPMQGDDRQLAAINVHWVQHCGYLAIGICDVSEQTLTCQRRLRAAWEARAEELRARLPAPGTVSGLPLSPLYERTWALAFGREAGDDCAGRDLRGQVWCAAFEAALGYERAVHAWQVGRLMGVIGPEDWDALSGTEDE